MPLKKGSSEAAFKSNVKELYAANGSKSPDKKRSRAQILAIAYSEKRKGKKK